MSLSRFRNLWRIWSARVLFQTFIARVGPCALRKLTSSFICGRSTRCRKRCTSHWRSLWIPITKWASSSMRRSTTSTLRCSRTSKKWPRVKKPALCDWLASRRSFLRLALWRRSGCKSGTSLQGCFQQVTPQHWLVNWLLIAEVANRLWRNQYLHSRACKRHLKSQFQVRPQQL